jgi:hypothetical protein
MPISSHFAKLSNSQRRRISALPACSFPPFRIRFIVLKTTFLPPSRGIRLRARVSLSLLLALSLRCAASYGAAAAAEKAIAPKYARCRYQMGSSVKRVMNVPRDMKRQLNEIAPCSSSSSALAAAAADLNFLSAQRLDVARVGNLRRTSPVPVA